MNAAHAEKIFVFRGAADSAPLHVGVVEQLPIHTWLSSLLLTDYLLENPRLWARQTILEVFIGW